MTIIAVAPPEACSWDINHLSVSMNPNMPTVNWILPDGVSLAPMGWFAKLVAGAPAITHGGVIHWNTKSYKWLPGEIIVHECVHNFQEKRMGWWGYRATYFIQIPIAFIIGGGFHWHDYHPMEKEARRIAQEVIAKCYISGQSLDINAAIKQVTGW